MATKGSGTVRPFVRLPSLDLLLYHALVEALAADIEAALGPREKIFAFRLDTSGAEDPFAGSPKWDDFMTSVRHNYATVVGADALTGDIASFFVYVDIDELERRLLAVCSDHAAVRDLGDLLRSWQQLGVRGLPQGLPPSSPLGNFYLDPLDRALESWGLEYRRYMDDFWVFTRSFEDARRTQDAIERLLYGDRLGLGGEKSRIRRVRTALIATESVEARIRRRREAILEDVLAGLDGEYVDTDEFELPEAEIDTAAVHGEFGELLNALREDQYPPDVRPRLTAVFRSLEKGRDPHAVADIPDVLVRLPDLTWPATRYAASMRTEFAQVVETTMLELLRPHRFHREQEWLHLCRGGLFVRHRPAPELAIRPERLPSSTSPLWARALLAWGKFLLRPLSVAGPVLLQSANAWRPYALVSLQEEPRARHSRYLDWSGEGRFLRNLAETL